MAILKTVCVIFNTMVSTLCCTLFQKQKIAEDTDCIKVDEKIQIDKIKDSRNKEYSDARTTLSVPLSACNQVSIRESNGESSKENSQSEGTINNTKSSCNCHIKQQQQQQEQQNSDKESQANVNDKYIARDNCVVILLKLEESYNASCRIEKIIQNSSNVTSSTQSNNLQSNCSTDNSTTSTLYMPCPKLEIQDTISKNKTYPITSTKLNSKHVKLHKRIAGIFYRCFK